MSLIQVRNAAFSYDAGTAVFHDISFEVNPGEAFIVVGPNGCGKSTLIDNLLGIRKLDEGEIEISGRNIRRMKPKEIAEHLAYVPQEHEKSFGYRVIDIVLMGRTYATRMFSSPSEEERALGVQALEQVGLKGFEEKEYTRLSGGELQLVLVARALAQQPDVLILDEPTAHLDFCHELGVMEIVAGLIKKKRLSAVMATHFLNQAYYLENAGVGTKVALMHQGRFQKTGTPSEILTPENLKSVFNIVAEVASGGRGERKYILALYSGRGKEET